MRSTFTLSAMAAAAVLLIVAPVASANERCASLQEAAHEALDEAMAISQEYEHGGVIFELEGCHYYSTPQSNGEQHTLEIRVRIPRGAQVAGLYHTHLDQTLNSSWFSGVDVEMHRQLNVPSFLGDTRTGKRYQLVYKKWHRSLLRAGVKGTPFERELFAATTSR